MLLKLGTDYQRSMKTAQADIFMACFQSKLLKVIFKTLHFGSMYNLSNAEMSTISQWSAAYKAKYLATLNSYWKSEFKWCQASSKGQDFAYCTSCRADFKVCYGGRNHVTKHMETMTHQKNYSSVSSTPTVSSMFNTSTTVDKVALAETLFVNYIAEHNYPFLMADHFTDLMKAMFSDSAIAQKFSCKRTKTTHILTQALANSTSLGHQGHRHVP